MSKDLIIKLLLSLLKKDKIIAFVAGAAITAASAALGVPFEYVHTAVCTQAIQHK